MSSEELITINPMLPLIFPVESDNAIDESIDPDAAWHFYSHSIQRNPTNLSLHVKRIFFSMQYKDGAYLSGALHDLYSVLKNAGMQLRIRLLKASVSFLSKKDLSYFASWVNKKSEKMVGYRWYPGSVLSNGLSGPDYDLLTPCQSKEEQTISSPIEEARACLEYGQLDVAKKILEEALEEDKENKALKQELACLLQHTEKESTLS